VWPADAAVGRLRLGAWAWRRWHGVLQVLDCRRGQAVWPGQEGGKDEAAAMRGGRARREVPRLSHLLWAADMRMCVAPRPVDFTSVGAHGI